MALCTWVLQDNNHVTHYYIHMYELNVIATTIIVSDNILSTCAIHYFYVCSRARKHVIKMSSRCQNQLHVCLHLFIFRASCGRLCPRETTRFLLVTKIGRDTIPSQ